MKKYLLFLTVLISFPFIAKANCWQIRNEDSRNMCLAKVKGVYSKERSKKLDVA